MTSTSPPASPSSTSGPQASEQRAVRVLLGGALMTTAALCWWLALPPRGWWVLFPLGVAAFMGALIGHRLRVRLVLGGLCGLIHYTLALQWVSAFSMAGQLVVVVLESILLAGVAAVSVGGDLRARGMRRWLLTPAALVLLEALQQRFPFGGFPLPSFAVTQVDGPLLSAAPVGGSLMVTGLAAVLGAALLALVLRPGLRARSVAAATASGVFLLPLSLAELSMGDRAGSLDAVVVQGGGPRGLRAFNTVNATAQHLRTADRITRSPDLVLLPESIGHARGPVGESPVGDRFARLARQLDTHVVAGITETEGDGYRNAAVLWGPDGTLQDRYEKHHRVPFGEYLPLRGLVERVSDHARLVPQDAIIGEGPAALRRDSPAPWGIVISYEVFFADRVRDAVGHGGQVLLVPTSAASFETEEVPAIEVAASRLRAREFDRAVLQAAPTGFSAIVRPDGAIEELSGLGSSELLEAEIPLRTGLTPYARTGDAPMLLLALAVVVWCRGLHALIGRDARGRRSGRHGYTTRRSGGPMTLVRPTAAGSR